MIVANWKMNQNISDIESYLNTFTSAFNGVSISSEIVIAPSFIHLALLKNNKFFKLSAQNVSQHESGAHTGEVSAGQLKDMSCEYVIVGHSERRAKGEKSEDIKKKALKAANNSITPIICIGETLEEREGGRVKEVLQKQIRESLPDIKLKKFVIAYEPVWAIGSGKMPNSADIQEAANIVREELSSFNSFEKNLSILYGGSVNTDNCKEITSIEGVDGLLIGGASLVAENFIEIIKKVN